MPHAAVLRFTTNENATPIWVCRLSDLEACLAVYKRRGELLDYDAHEHNSYEHRRIDHDSLVFDLVLRVFPDDD
jgi:hypothetical protein